MRAALPLCSHRPAPNPPRIQSPIAVTGKIKLELQAGKANPAPPVGPALGAKVSGVARRRRRRRRRRGAACCSVCVADRCCCCFAASAQCTTQCHLDLGAAVACRRCVRARAVRRKHKQFCCCRNTARCRRCCDKTTSKHTQNTHNPTHTAPIHHAGRQHHGVLQGVQRRDRQDGRRHYPRRDHRVRGPQLHVRAQDAAGGGAAEEGGGCVWRPSATAAAVAGGWLRLCALARCVCVAARCSSAAAPAFSLPQSTNHPLISPSPLLPPFPRRKQASRRAAASPTPRRSAR